MESNYQKIYTGNAMLGKRITAELKAQGIEPIIKNEGESARLAGFGILNNQSIELYAHKDEAEKAMEVINTIRKNA